MSQSGRDWLSPLDPATQGQTLSEKAVDVHMVGGQEMIARWYHSPNEADLLVWFNSIGDLVRFQLNSMGQVTDWGLEDGLHTGLIIEIEWPSRQAVECAETIQFDSEPNLCAISSARELILNGTALPTSVRSVIYEVLSRSWPNVRRNRVSSSRTRFWERFKRWTIGT